MTAWAGKAVCKALTLTAKSYSTELKKASKNFSHPAGKNSAGSAGVEDDRGHELQAAEYEPRAPAPKPKLIQISEDGGGEEMVLAIRN